MMADAKHSSFAWTHPLSLHPPPFLAWAIVRSLSRSVAWLTIGWKLVCWLVGWFVGWPVGWRLVGLSVGWFVGWLFGRLPGCCFLDGLVW